ncbi:MAG: C39 family peptidase [Nocardioides sp.]
MSRRRTIAIGSLALLLLGAPFLPDGDTPPALETGSAPGVSLADATAGAGTLTPAMRQEIDAVLAAGRTAARATAGARLRPAALVRSQVRCADFEGQRYCLNAGWTASTEDQVVTELARSATSESARSTYREETGDLTLTAQLRQRAALSPAARERADRAELTAAARSVAKVWLLRHQVQGVPLPDGFLARHPEIRTRTASGTTTAASTATSAASADAPRKSFADYPARGRVLRNSEVAEQTRTYWCGPTSMQMIGWGWSHQQHSQQYWAGKLGTTSEGTAISEMVKVTNRYTGWDRAAYAGKYVVLDIKDWSYRQWYVLQMRHTVDYRAPVILHPVLLKKWYPYLDDDASGHFQVGRGYSKNGDRPNLLRYFEPWNQQRFDRSEPYIDRRQLKSAYRAYRANREHFQHNIGV